MAGAASMPSHGEFSIGRVLARATDTIRQRFGAMLIIALLLAALPVPIRLLGADAFLQAMRGGGGSQFFTYLLTLAVGAVVGALCDGALIWLAVGAAERQRIDAADALFLALRSAPRLIGLYLMIQVSVSVAMLLLIVPGIMMTVALAAAMPAAAIEARAGTKAFDRSFDLTKGARWQIFALWLMMWIALGVVALAIRATMGTPTLRGDALPIAYFVVQGIVATASAIVAAALQSAVYVELRTWKEGAPRGELSDIFA